MRFIVIGALLLGGLAFGVVLKKFVWPAIKADPVANLILPVATALLTSLLPYKPSTYTVPF